MQLSQEAKLMNRVAQGRLPFTDAVRWFESLSETDRELWLKTVAFMCHQSHPHREEIEGAIALGGLKPTYTPCLMLLEAEQPEYVLDRVAALPAGERLKAFRLIFALYCIADTRRRDTNCRNGCSHEWHNFDHQ